MVVITCISKALQNIAAKPRNAALALLALCCVVYLPGIMRLPAVDRTEVVYADSTRDMVARGQWLDPRYDGTVHAFRPIGTFWAQGLSATLAGAAHARDIWVYRLPGFLAVTLSTLALYWLSAPLFGSSTALIASGLFAVAPLTALLANLAIAESLSLLPATVAMLSLLRIYTSARDDDTRRLAVLFWAALGFGVLFNAFLVPILVIVTLIALRFMDRDMWWLEKLHTLPGLPLAVLIASPWIIVRCLQDGVPFAGLDLPAVIRALGGAQDMKHRAWPGTFVLATLIGFLPGTVLLAPALRDLWSQREGKIARFLLAWIIGYLFYLEILSSKPGTYMVQTLFPALALSVAMCVSARDGAKPALRFFTPVMPVLAAAFAIALMAVPFALLREMPSLSILPFAAAVAALFAWSAYELAAGHLKRWASTGIAALALFAISMLAVILPSISAIWPAQQIQRALASCPLAPIGLLGFNEPTTRFLLKRDANLSTAGGLGKLADGAAQGNAVISDSWNEQNPHALKREQQTKIAPIACIRAVDVMRACVETMTIVANNSVPPCPIPAEFECTGNFVLQASAPSHIRRCD